MRSSSCLKYSRGFTLIEAVMVIVIIGIIGSVVAVFIRGPVQGYFDAVRRAELTDAADVAMRRMTRDVRLSLPNSLRIRDTTTLGSCAAGTCYVEFIMTSTGGRYRDPSDGSTGGHALSFTTASDTSFDVLGAMPSNPSMNVGDYIVIYNLGEGYTPANAYVAADPCTQCNRAKISDFAGNLVKLASNPFASQTPPLPSPSARFQVVPGATKAVTFACPTTTPGDLSRYANYGFNATQSIPSGATPVLAGGVTCAVDYTNNATGRSGLLTIQLTLWNAARDESVTLFQQIHVDNSP